MAKTGSILMFILKPVQVRCLQVFSGKPVLILHHFVWCCKLVPVKYGAVFV